MGHRTNGRWWSRWLVTSGSNKNINRLVKIFTSNFTRGTFSCLFCCLLFRTRFPNMLIKPWKQTPRKPSSITTGSRGHHGKFHQCGIGIGVSRSSTESVQPRIGDPCTWYLAGRSPPPPPHCARRDGQVLGLDVAGWSSIWLFDLLPPTFRRIFWSAAMWVFKRAGKWSQPSASIFP